MIKIFKGIHRSIIIEFDEMGNCDILLMFNELYEGKEYKLRVEFDMGLIQKKKKDERENIILICKQDNERDSVFKIQDENIVWVINQDDIELGIERFSECKKDVFFSPAEFIQMSTPKNKKLDYVYCRLVQNADFGVLSHISTF